MNLLSDFQDGQILLHFIVYPRESKARDPVFDRHLDIHEANAVAIVVGGRVRIMLHFRQLCALIGMENILVLSKLID